MTAISERTAVRRPPGRTGGRRVRRHGWATPYLFLVPYGVLFIGFILLPAIYGIWISLHDYDYLL
ncbi:MAG: sugar ABC transporter permease, partial [Actinobacteria bacterium]|nr:sugar ABC transporter permease [Actinomycetota bacterium]